MATPDRSNASRHRRRIAVAGLVVGAVAFVVGAPIYLSRIESDLERTVPEELAAAGFAGVSASFSGQDGTLTCSSPLGDPEQALAAAYDVRGVRAIELDRSCRVNRAPVVGTTTTLPGEGSMSTDDESDDRRSEPAPTLVPPDFASLSEVLVTDPDFSLLLVLVGEAGLEAELADPSFGPVTMFAPTDAAFDSLPADALARLRADPDALADVLRHHMVAGRLAADELVTGALMTLMGDTIDVDVDGPAITVDDATVTRSDAAAGNGLVHTIDSVLLPASVVLDPPHPTAEVSAALADGVLTLEGVVAGEAERAVLTGAALTVLAADRVVDRLEIDPETGLDAGRSDDLARLLVVMPANLVSGEAGYEGSALFVNGVALSQDAADAVAAVAAELDVPAGLTQRPIATEADAAALEVALNELVATTPIHFEQGGTELLPDAESVVDRIAILALALDGVAIVVEGHTDGDGSPSRNAQLSQARADAVRDALVVRGLGDSSVTAEGLGSQRRIFVDGREDKEASRRVEFRVTAAGSEVG